MKHHPATRLHETTIFSILGNDVFVNDSAIFFLDKMYRF
jgi:hypothetical protein